jgi:hypothetical protein
MGLDCSHDAWHGAYSRFMSWRKLIANLAGLPPLELMEGFFGCGGTGTLYFGQRIDDHTYGHKQKDLEDRLPISWDCLKPSPIHALLCHSDCDGEIAAEDCEPIAKALEDLLPSFPDHQGQNLYLNRHKEDTEKFIAGLRLAAALGESLEFH